MKLPRSVVKFFFQNILITMTVTMLLGATFLVCGLTPAVLNSAENLLLLWVLPGAGLVAWYLLVLSPVFELDERIKNARGRRLRLAEKEKIEMDPMFIKAAELQIQLDSAVALLKDWNQYAEKQAIWDKTGSLYYKSKLLTNPQNKGNG